MGAWGTPSCLLPEHCHPQGNVICFSSKRKKEKKALWSVSMKNGQCGLPFKHWLLMAKRNI
jgi:hypothetical protein